MCGSLASCGARNAVSPSGGGPTRHARKFGQSREARPRYVPAFLFATVRSGLGEPEKALTFLEKEYDARGWSMLIIKYAPQFDDPHAHPRFQALIRRMTFPDSSDSS